VSRARRWMGRAGWALALLASAPSAARADDPPCRAASTESPRARAWPPPLDRALALDARDLSLRDALDRLSAAARIRISYSAQLLPLERRVCVSPAARTVGDVLAELLRATSVEPVVAGADHVVLAPRRAAAEGALPSASGEARAEFSHTVELDRIVVTGSAGGGPQRALPYALDVIGRDRIEREGMAPLTRLLTASGAAWAWEQGPSSLAARYGSIRGASSFGVSGPKVFIDGIEVANPLLAMRLAPESIERIEVIRGPQGAALYGTDAISGVVNVVTRHEGTDAGAPRLRVRGGLGVSSTGAGLGAVAREGAAAFRRGSTLRSVGVDLGYGGVGEYVPGAGGHYLLASGSARAVAGGGVYTGTARVYTARSAVADNPLLLRQPSLGAAEAEAARQQVAQYTLGGTARWAWDERWSHALTAGVDGNRVAGLPDDATALPSAAETALRASEGGADRGTLRWSSVARLRDDARGTLALTLAAEHSVLRQEIAADRLMDLATLSEGGRAGASWVTVTHSTGVVAQANAAVMDRLHLTAGLRLERNEGLTDRSRYAALPVLGGAYVAPLGGDATLKVRGAYGKGIRPARTASREQAWAGAHSQLLAGLLAPEEQSGVEGGFDLALGDLLSLQVTAYDQLASGLIQRVAQPSSSGSAAPPLLQNVGEISNRGWEMQGSAVLGRVSLTGAFSAVDSRVRRVAAGYGGDLRAGDRMLEVPARTLALTGGWNADRWSLSLTGTRAFDWVNYDRQRLARDLASGGAGELAGAPLREYWRGYDGATRLDAVAALDVRPGVVLVLSGANLLDHRRGEPDNLSLVPGRTLSLGVRANF
jgi:outer membrane cobalamin receptor